MSKAYLILENGQVFEAESFGYEKEVIAELVFSTSMAGYMELLTDPGYYGQMVVQSFPLIGNVGYIGQDMESDKIHLSAYIVRECAEVPSNFRCEGDLRSFLIENKIPAVSGVDTRALVKIIRDNGVMNAKISFSKDYTTEELEEIKGYEVVNAVKSVTSTEVVKKDNGKEKTVALINFGIRASAEKMLDGYYNVIKLPADVTAEEVLSYDPDGIILSDGPGNPKENEEIIRVISSLVNKKPILAFGLGHELLALANGLNTKKLRYGHIGSNQPVRDEKTGRVYITSQNHGYFVTDEISEEKAVIRFRNVNDSTCEGIEYKNGDISTQFSVDLSDGPQNTSFILGQFSELMK
ncbi:MAG: carbamoyl phosphate synthase small subunit [Eubacteriaceae bacterium]|nr:carbamoyl phosphate synthase small subunit [Eubacteriaceae bacterium]